MIRKLTDHKASQCHVEINEFGNIYFYSYATMVISVKEGWLTCTGLYSMTTRKQIGWFLREYFPSLSFQFVKSLYENGETYNVLTGEIKYICA